MRIRGLLLIAVMVLTSCAPAGMPAANTQSTASAKPIDSAAPTAMPAAQSSGSQQMESTPLPTGPKAPAINNQVWLNTDQPLTQADLDGKVRLVEFWTFDCINCTRTIPAMNALYNMYKAKGLLIVGVHSPEFQFEHDLNNVKDAIARLDVRYPVAIDNDFTTWNAFNNRYWPALYFIDKRGVIRYNHIGELHQAVGDWNQVTQLIDTLLKE